MAKTRTAHPRSGRFARRSKRIARRDERDRFSFIAGPVIWLLVLLGGAALCAVALHASVADAADRLLWGLAGMPLLVAVLLASFRFLRGHFDGDLDEP